MNNEKKEVLPEDLICPFMTKINDDSLEIINCQGHKCAYSWNCFKEPRYNENLQKFYNFSMIFLLGIICIIMLFLR